jgi:uncharacterized protein
MIMSYVCIAFLGFLVFGLGLNVSLHRMKTKSDPVVLKNPSSPISRARVAHSNACQYAPMFSILILLNQEPLGGVLGIVAVLARYLHAFGFLAFPKAGPNPFIFGGAVGTYLSGLVLSLLLLYRYVPV